jgi:hypothetical protein
MREEADHRLSGGLAFDDKVVISKSFPALLRPVGVNTLIYNRTLIDS